MINPLKDRKIILGITGSIAAYKAVELASRLTQAGAQVDVVLTESAEKFIAPLTFQSVTGRKAFTDADLWGGEGHVTHVGLGHAAELIIIAPASANTLAKLTQGIGDNLLSLTVLAAHCPVVIAPAMDAGMYAHPATQSNVEILKQRGIHFIGPAEGHLASGLVGLGRLVEPLEIQEYIQWVMSRQGVLAGKKIVVTAGGTQEPIDPVRYITNRSSGRQGYAVAQSALHAGADVELITAPVQVDPPIGCTIIRVRSAKEMQEAVISLMTNADVLIMAAAVSDFRPAEISNQKLKKSSQPLELSLEPTDDILSEVDIFRRQSGRPFRVIGFAAESQNLIKHAQAKLKGKGLDMIVANDITASDAGFEVTTNKVTFLYKDGSIRNIPLMDKNEVAGLIIEQVIKWFENSSGSA